MSQIGRNDLCPCGSGKKFKKCCLGKLAEATQVLAWQNVQARQWIQVDHQLFAQLLPLLQRYPKEAKATLDRLELTEAEEGFVINWMAHHLPIEGRTMSQEFHQTGKMSGEMRRLLECQLESPLSIFEIQEVQPGRGLRIKDLLLGDDFFLWDVGASESAQPHAGMLGWVLTIGALVNHLTDENSRTAGRCQVSDQRQLSDNSQKLRIATRLHIPATMGAREGHRSLRFEGIKPQTATRRGPERAGLAATAF